MSFGSVAISSKSQSWKKNSRITILILFVIALRLRGDHFTLGALIARIADVVGEAMADIYFNRGCC